MHASLFQGPEFSADVGANLTAIEAAAAAASKDGSTILITPEMSATGYNIGHLIADRAEPHDGPIFDSVADIARRHSIAIVYGYPERVGDAVYNATQVVSADGMSVARYRKTHLFGGLDRDNFAPGEALLSQFDFGDFRCGLLTCYDVEFPETVRAHADAGTQWLIVPTGLMTPFELVAQQIVPTRAYESQLFISYVNRCGIEADLTYCGLSCAVGPDGSDIARASTGQSVVTFDLDPARLGESRSINTHLSDRRHDLYPSQQRPSQQEPSNQEKIR